MSGQSGADRKEGSGLSLGHEIIGLTPGEAWARERAPQHKKLKFEAHMGRTQGTWAPPYPKAAGKEGDWCSDRGHRAAGTGKGFESTKEKAS